MKTIARSLTLDFPSILLWITVVIAITMLSLIPDYLSDPGMLGARVSNLGHIPAYGVLAFVTLVALSRAMRFNGWVILSTGLCVIAFGLILEITQGMVGRMTSASDMTLNAVGTILGIGAFVLLNRAGLLLTMRRSRK